MHMLKTCMLMKYNLPPMEIGIGQKSSLAISF